MKEIILSVLANYEDFKIPIVNTNQIVGKSIFNHPKLHAFCNRHLEH